MLGRLVRKRLGTGCCFHAPLFPTDLQLLVALFVLRCATTITLPLLVKIRFSLLLLSGFFFILLSISIVPSTVDITCDDLMPYLSICARITVFPCVSTVFLLSVRCLPVAFVHCGQTVGWIRMPLGVRLGFDPGHIVLDGDLPKGLRLEFRKWTG